ncbi:MAG TPA: M36 family metallopeptidase [Microcoleus sp.]|nr:M36 family metallopeptidase [Microcoleus sp.]
MFYKDSSLSHPANRNRVDAFVSGVAAEPVAVASAQRKTFLAQRSGSSLVVNTMTGNPAYLEGKLSMTMTGTAADASRSFLMENPGILGLSAEDTEELTEVDSFEWGGLKFIRRQQNHQGLPVFGASVLVGVDDKNQVRIVTSGLRSQISVKPGETAISLKEARQIARKDLGEAVQLRAGITHKTVLYPTQQGDVRVYHLTVPAETPLGDWEYFIDVQNGEIVDSYNSMKFHSFYFAPRARVYSENPEETPLKTVMLRDVKSPYNKLDGRYCKVINEDASGAVVGSNYRFDFPPEDTHFDECQVYYAVEKVYQYFSDLGFRGFTVNNPYGKVNAGQIAANVHTGTKYDNAYYSSSTGQIYFGDGSYPGNPGGLRDLAKEVDVVAHELTHAMIDEYHPGMFGSEGAALHEGYADYFACSLLNDPDLGEYVVPAPEKSGMIRNCDNDLKYSETSTESHDRGQAWAGACWHLRKKLGQEVADFLIFGSMLVLGTTSPTFKYAKDMLLAVDQSWCGGEYKATIKRIFETERGIPV